jgi:hypothetical protein
MKNLLTSLVTCVLAVSCQVASAGTVILDLEGGTAGTELDGTNTYTEDGYLLEYWAGQNPVFVDTGGNLALGDGLKGTGGSFIASGLQISRVDGQLFDLLALDVANLGTAPADIVGMSIAAGSTSLEFRPAIGDGFVTETITDPAFSNITTLNVSLVAESYPQDFLGSDNYVVDNFQVRSTASSQVVPEPASLSIFACGVFGLVLHRRRRSA